MCSNGEVTSLTAFWGQMPQQRVTLDVPMPVTSASSQRGLVCHGTAPASHRALAPSPLPALATTGCPFLDIHSSTLPLPSSLCP